MEAKKYIPEAWQAQWRKSMDFLYSYKPMKAENVSQRDWDVRKLIWAFKDGRQTEFCAKIVAQRLMKVYGSKVKQIAFACIPASSAEKNVVRYQRFAELVCQLTGCVNAFHAIKVSGQRLAIHEHGRSKRISSTQVIDFDSAFFAGREVVVFDDILTQGKSYAQFACALEAIGASVIGGLFLGRTMYC